MREPDVKKPTLFISHAVSDAEFAIAVKQEIEKVFEGQINVYCTSSPGMIPPGQDWLSDVEEKLSSAQAIVAIITPVSIERPWLWFEVGATWLKGRAGGCRIYPLCTAEIKLENLPSPLDRLQALSMGKAADLKLLFEALIKQFGCGKISTFRASNITARIPKYKNVKVAAVDLNDAGFYSGKYAGYGDDELMEIIDTKVFLPDEENFTRFSTTYRDREDLIHNGKLLHFRQVDKQLDLPPGTAYRLLDPVAERYGLKPVLKKENLVRYGGRRRRS